MTKTTWQPKAYKDYKWIVKDPELLHGSLAIRGTRLPVWLILEGLGNGMTVKDFEEDYGGFPKEALPEIRQWLLVEGSKFHTKVRKHLARYDLDTNNKIQGMGGQRVGLTAFSFICEGKNNENG